METKYKVSYDFYTKGVWEHREQILNDPNELLTFQLPEWGYIDELCMREIAPPRRKYRYLRLCG
jgi:hypothetical protein